MFELVDRLPQVAACFLELTFHPLQVGLRGHEFSVDLRDLAARRLGRGLLPRAVELEDQVTFFDAGADHPRSTSATRPEPSGRMGIVLKNAVTLLVEG